MAYEMTRKAHESHAVPLPVALFEAAVSPPHMYAQAVMKLYLQAGEQLDLNLILEKLRGWDTMPREQLMQVSPSTKLHTLRFCHATACLLLW